MKLLSDNNTSIFDNKKQCKNKSKPFRYCLTITRPYSITKNSARTNQNHLIKAKKKKINSRGKNVRQFGCGLLEETLLGNNMTYWANCSPYW